LSEIEATGSVLFGVSVDDVDSHKRFRAEEKFGFSLLADTEFEVSNQYSGIIENFNASKRTTFIIDKAGYIRAIDNEVKTKTHGEDVVALLKEVLPKIEVGQPAPDFVATDSTGKSYQLSELIEKQNVVLSFYPRDFGRG
jgi:peroxiredoxin